MEELGGARLGGGVAEAVLQVCVRAQEVDVRRDALLKVVEGGLGVGEEEDVDDREGEPVDVPHVKVVHELGGLPRRGGRRGR